MNRAEQARWEVERHATALDTALCNLAACGLPDDIARIEADEDLVRRIDQILFRFTKLQDAIGQRLIPSTLSALGEPYEDWPMRDRLERLDRLGYLSVDSWLTWRDVRNRLAHEYPEAPADRLANLRAAIAAAGGLVQCAQAWLARFG